MSTGTITKQNKFDVRIILVPFKLGKHPKMGVKKMRMKNTCSLMNA